MRGEQTAGYRDSLADYLLKTAWENAQRLVREWVSDG